MEILTPFQKRILTAIGHSDLAPSFYLTGGTALAVYHLQHRYSEDLDFFADAREAMTGVTAIASEIAQDLDAGIEFTRAFPTFVETFLTNQAGERVKIDFAFDTPFRLQPTITDPAYGIRLDNLIDMTSNKLAALFGRSESKDFVDIYFICQELMPFATLYEQANQKHVGMTHYWLALAMRNVMKVQFLPRMIKPLQLTTLQDYFLGLADQLMADIGDLSP
ncbi:MAG: nucleotidyl transferase AbiEii/AbiGii toxin family protein [Anaerolineae bacterium]